MKNLDESLSEDLKNDPSFKDLETVDDLAKSYLHINKAYSERYEGLGKDDSWETMSAKLSKFSHLPNEESQYNVEAKEHPEVVKRLGFKYKLHPHQASAFAKDFHEAIKGHHETVRKSEVEEFKKNSESKFSDIKDKDVLMAKVANTLGVSMDDFKSKFGRRFHSPVVQDLIFKYAKTLGKEPSDDSKNFESTSKAVGGDQHNIEADRDFYKSMIDNRNSAFYDTSNPEHAKVRKEVFEAGERLAEYQKENNIEVDL